MTRSEFRARWHDARCNRGDISTTSHGGGLSREMFRSEALAMYERGETPAIRDGHYYDAAWRADRVAGPQGMLP